MPPPAAGLCVGSPHGARGAPPQALSAASVSAAVGLPWSSESTYLPSAEEKGKGALPAEG